jgi:hypothetical protein
MSISKLLPYRALKDGIEATWTVKSIKGGKVPEIQDAAIDATDLPDASKFKIVAELKLAESRMKSLVPKDERSDPPLEMVLLVRSPMSSHRSLILAKKAKSGSTYKAELSFCKAEFTRTVTITPALLRRGDRGSTSGYASHRGAILATGDPLKVSVDEAPETTGSYMDLIPEDFAESANAARRDNSDLIYSVDLSAAEPRIYINTGLKNVKKILFSTATQGKEMRARTALFDVIATGVWTSLVTDATRLLASNLESSSGDIEEAFENLDGWQRDIVESWAQEITGESSEEEGIQALSEIVLDPSLSQRISFAVQRQADSGKNLDGLRRLARGDQL